MFDEQQLIARVLSKLLRVSVWLV